MKSSHIRLVLAGVGAFALLGALLGWAGAWRILRDRAALEEIVLRLGPWGPGVIVVAEVLQVLAAPVPGQIVGLLAGYLYGPIWGTALCTGGLMVGSLLAMWLGRRLGRPLVERMVGGELLARIDGYLARHGPTALFLVFLLPFLPDDLCCFIAGLTPLRYGEMLILALLGRTPGVFVSTLIGAQARRLAWPQMLAIGIASLVLAVLFLRYRGWLEEHMYRLIDRWPRRRHHRSDL